VVLFEDETILRLFPPLRAKWAWRGSQPQVRISGANGRRVLFGAINPKTGHRILMKGASMRQEEFQAFLRLLHHRYHGRRLCLILDEASCHNAKGTDRLAESLGVERLYLPKQSPELNPMDHLWRPAKGRISANRQYRNVQQQADYLAHFVHQLTPMKALRLAGILSKDFWLPQVRKNFWLPT
jgi:transposase